MAYAGLPTSLRVSHGETSFVTVPKDQRIVKVSDFAMELLKLAAAGNTSLFDLTTRLARAYEIDTSRAEVLTLEAIYALRNYGLVVLSESPLPSKNVLESAPNGVGRILMNLTYRCNFRCTHCLQGAKTITFPPELTTEEWLHVVREISDLGISMIFVSGGEPFMRRDAIRILREAEQYALSTRIYTNASLLGKKQAELLSQIEGLTVQVSLHGIDPGTCDPFVGIDGAFDRVYRAIQLLTDRGARVSVATCFRDELIDRMDEFPSLLADMGVSEWVPTLIMPMGCAFENWSSFRVSDEKIRVFMESLLRLSSIYKGTDFQIYSPFDVRLLQGGNDRWQATPRMTFGCDLYGQYINIGPQGDVHPCDRLTNLALGNILEEPLGSILSKKDEIRLQKAENLDLLRRRGIWQRCSKCEYRSLCGMGCPAILFKGREVGEEEYDPVVCRMFRKCFDVLLKYSTFWAARSIRQAIGKPFHASAGA